MYTRVYFSLLLAFALGIILVSSAPVDPRSQLAESHGKARRKFSLPKVPTAPAPAKPPPKVPTPPIKPPPTPPKPPVGVTTKPSVAPSVPTKSALIASTSTKLSVTSAASSSASSAALSSASSAASSSASSAASSAVSSSAPSVASSAASSSVSSAASAPSASTCALPPKTKSVRSILERSDGITSGTDTPVCGIPFRLGSLPTKCESNPVSFTTPLTPLTKNSNTQGSLSAGTQCDHALELQALKFTMDQSGACRAIDAIIKAGGQTNPSPATQKQSLLSAMFDQINGQGNAFSLDSGVNGAKKLVVQAGLTQGATCTASPSTELLKAVDAYFTDSSINGPTIALASTLDGLANTAVNTAATNALDAINCMPEGSARQKAAKTNAQQAVASGKALYTSQTAMATAWNNVLGCAAHLAA